MIMKKLDDLRPIFIELTQFPQIAIFHGQYNEPQSGEIELRQSLVSDSEAQYFGVDYGSVRAKYLLISL